MAFIFSDSPPFAFGSQFPVLSFQFSARTLLVQNDYKVARSGAQGHAIQCGQSLNLLNWRCNVYLDVDSKTPPCLSRQLPGLTNQMNFGKESLSCLPALLNLFQNPRKKRSS